MVGIFKQKNPGNALLLLVYALILKFSIFLHPLPPLRQDQDHYLYNWLLKVLDSLHLPGIIYSFIAFILLFTQASLFNRICNAQKMLPKTNYLPGMAYLLLTSLFTDWNYFSAPLIVNSLLIWIFYRMTTLYDAYKTGGTIFNIGLLTGIITLIYEPAIIYVVVLWMSLFIMRPFRIREWLISILGVTTPYYFLAIVLFLGNHRDLTVLLPVVSLNLPAIPSSVLITISIILLVLPFITGGYYVQNNLTKMLIQVRKNWSLLLIFLIVAVLIILSNGTKNYINWVLCVIPLSAFHAATYFYPNKKAFPMIVHWLIFGYALYINYWL